MALSWISVNANDGTIIADLPTLRVDGALKKTLMRYESQTVSLTLDEAPPNWRQHPADDGIHARVRWNHPRSGPA